MAADPQPALRTTSQSPAVPSLPIWRLTVNQYHSMIETGILTDDDPVELLEGWLVAKMPKNPRHRLVTQLMRETLAHILPAGWYVDAQEPITTEDSEPEPDIVVVRGERRDYSDRHPGPQDLALVIEVADTTLQRDRTLKKRLYARAGIPIYWIVNLTEKQIEVYTALSTGSEQRDYQQRHDYDLTAELPLLLDDNEVGRLAIRELLQ